jgi:hypothetical protein
MTLHHAPTGEHHEALVIIPSVLPRAGLPELPTRELRRILLKRTSENAQKAKFAESLF